MSQSSASIFLNQPISDDIDYEQWWKEPYPKYQSKYDNVYYYYDKAKEEECNKIDIQTGITLAQIDKKELNDEEKEQKSIIQCYDNSKPIYISPMTNLYHANMLFRQLIDFEIDYNNKNKNSYQTIYPVFRKNFYEFCKRYSKNNNIKGKKV